MITFENLSKRYGRVAAVDGISFTVPAGTVTGFLGPNGAGKSTALRALVGLTPPTSGSATIGGRRYADLPNPGARVGVMLDASAQHAGRTGREVLTLVALHVGVPRSRVEELIALVGLTDDEAARRVRAYSLGMRQRLGLACALVGSPEVLILDEPVNGLDPQGIHWMRRLLRGFADAGGTVLLSSHLLGEVQAVADDIVIIGNGRIVAQGHTADLITQGGTIVAARDLTALAAALADAGLEVTAHGSGLLADAHLEEVGQVALGAGIPLTELRAGGTGGLEEMFLALTDHHSRETKAA